jgi:hypothetical protein
VRLVRSREARTDSRPLRLEGTAVRLSPRLGRWALVIGTAIVVLGAAVPTGNAGSESPTQFPLIRVLNWDEMSTGPVPVPQSYSSISEFVLTASDSADGELLVGELSPNPNSGPPFVMWSFARNVWSELPATEFPPFGVPVMMTYDGADGYVVTFGAYENYTLQPATWSFAGATWKNLTTSVAPPPPRGDAGMVYDPALKAVVLVEGSGRGATWEFQAGVWRNVTAGSGMPTTPQPAEVDLAYDPSSERLIDFGVPEAPIAQHAYAVLQDWAFDGRWASYGQPSQDDGCWGGWGSPLLGDAQFPGVIQFNWDGTPRGNCVYADGVWTTQPVMSYPQTTFGILGVDPVTGAVVLAGGWSPVNGSYQFVNETWTLTVTPAPPAPTPPILLVSVVGAMGMAEIALALWLRHRVPARSATFPDAPSDRPD